MSLYLDLDDVAAESPLATKELAELRRDLLYARAAIAWITGTSDVDSVIAGATAARAAEENKT